MPTWVIDLVIVVLILVVTYAITSEGLWGSALVFFNVLFSTMIALNFYEPLATLIASNASAMKSWADFICLGGLFVVSLIAIKIVTEQIAPLMVRFPQALYQVGRLIFGLGAAAISVAFLLLVLNAAPVPRKIFNILDYKSKPPFGLGLDRKLLAFFQYSTGYTFPSYGAESGDREFKSAKVFDPGGRWLIDHQNTRIGSRSEGLVPEPEAESSAVAATGSTEGGSGQNPSGTPGADNSPRIPGGTGGAAVGLAPQG